MLDRDQRHTRWQANKLGVIEQSHSAPVLLAVQRLFADRPAIVYLLLFYVAYVIAGAVARKMQIIPGHTVAFWPAAGIFIATLLAARRSTWAWWVVTGCLAEMTCNALFFRNSVPAALGFYAANALEALTAAYLLRRFGADPFRLQSARELAAFIVFGAGLAPVVGATLGGLTHVLAQGRPFMSDWSMWWLGDASGLLVSGPLAISVIQVWRGRAEITALRAAEAVSVTVILVVVAVLALGGYFPTIYVTLPALLWAALRFQIRGASIAVAVLALVTATTTLLGYGEFAGSGEILKQRLVELKVFLGITAISSLFVGVLSELHHEAIAQLRRLNVDLESLVAARTAELRSREEALSYALRGANAGAWEHELGHERGTWSAKCKELHGLAPNAEAPTFEDWLELLHPEDRAGVRAQLEKAHADQLSELELEYRIIHTSRGTRWISNRFRIEYDRRGIAVRQGGIHTDVTDRKRSDERLRLLMQEVNHRAKNMLSLVLVMVRQASASSVAELAEKIQSRVQALAANQDILVKSDWSDVPLRDLLQSQLAHFADLVGSRITFEGEALTVSASSAQTIGLAIHELATNAAKYGALASQTGRIEVIWDCFTFEGRRRFNLTWREIGGPPVKPPDRKGFGSLVTLSMPKLAMDADVEVRYEGDGLVWCITCDVEKLV